MDYDAYRTANQSNWGDRVPIHARSQLYDLDGFVADPGRLSATVDFDRQAIGDVSGRTLVHLQCHLGDDTLSWARLGATVTGVDFSADALEVARDLARRVGVDARFVETDVYDAPAALDGQRYDVVYSGVGALNWLPDVRRWVEVVAALLTPGGRLLLREGHPMLWTLDHDREDDLLVVNHPYFETAEPERFDSPETYADGDATFEHTTTFEWNHGFGELLGAVLEAGLVIDSFAEHRHVAWQPWHLFEPAPVGFQLPERLRDRVPLMYTLVAHRPV